MRAPRRRVCRRRQGTTSVQMLGRRRGVFPRTGHHGREEHARFGLKADPSGYALTMPMGTQDTFRVVVPVDGAPRRIAPGHAVLCIGSCFADAIGDRLHEHCFDADVNPFGTVYNPVTAANTIDRLLSGKRYRTSELFEHEGLWRSFDHHTALTAPGATQCVRTINARLADANRRMARLDVLMVTFGTAHVWELRDSGRVVANCHRLPQNRFVRRLLTVDEIVERWSSLLRELYTRLPSLAVVLTVSPVRYLRDGLHENS
ncbi:MAG: hypothetical protein GF331_15275, partial [Chitinivibrionales bacterium]|nr:hypothetical protein [Chitinivibrionales bacterium]